MANFREKAIFVWNDNTIGNPAQIVAMLQAANFEAAYLHYQNLSGWRTPSRIALAAALKAAGIAVYASVAVYGQDPAGDGRAAAAIVNQYGLAGFVFDVEAGLYETATDAPYRARAMLTAYKQSTDKPSAFCGWPFYHAPGNPARRYHNRDVLIEAMKIADVGMPMAYPEGTNTPAGAIAYLEAVYSQWRAYTNKPLVMAGRAFNGGGGTANPASIGPYSARALALGAVGVSYWDMEHALLISGMWSALTAIPKIGNEPEPEEPNMNAYKDNALLYFANSVVDGGWANDGFTGYVCHACNGVGTPNAELKPMEEKAAAAGKPYIIEYGFDVSFYTGGQLAMEEDRWPPLELDEPLRMLTRAVMNRNPVEVWVTLANPNDHTGKPADPQWIDYAARMFLKKLSEWKKANGKTWRIRVVTSWDFMNTYAPGKLNWLGDYATAINQGAKAPLDASYPQATDKPGWLGAIEGWKFWWYTSRLIIFNGNLTALETELKTEIADPGVPGEPTDPTPQTDVLKALAALSDKLDTLAAKMEAQEAANANRHETAMGAVCDVVETLERIFK